MRVVIESGLGPGRDLVVMGKEARLNPRAVEAAIPRRVPGPGDVAYNFTFETVIEINAEKMAEISKAIEAAQTAGTDPRLAIPAVNPKDNPEWFDYVVYNRPMVGRPSVLAINANQIPTATIRWSEHLRIPLVELNRRADEAFANSEARGQSH